MFVSRRGHTLRSGRVSVANTAYILTTVCEGRRPWFQDFDIGCAAARAITLPLCWREARLLAWVLMPDHLHLLVQLERDGDISRIMQRLKSLSSAAIRRAGNPAFAWQKGFHDHALRTDESLVAAARYIIANPRRAGIVDRIGDYAFWDAVWIKRDDNLLL